MSPERPMLAARHLTGRGTGLLVEVEPGQWLLPEVGEAYRRLSRAAAEAGFQLAIASAHRDYGRQLAIFNGKVRGERPVHDDRGEPVDVRELDVDASLAAILRFSALPGASRHHWGTDLDVFDASALEEGDRVQLVPAEVAPQGPFGPFHAWLDERIASGESFGFYRPYTGDYCGVAPERWHLSYAPLAALCEACFSEEVLRQCWRESRPPDLLDQLEARLPELFERYVKVQPGWCPAP